MDDRNDAERSERKKESKIWLQINLNLWLVFGHVNECCVSAYELMHTLSR